MLQGGKVKVTTFAQKSSFGLVHRIFLKKKKERKKKKEDGGSGGFSRHNRILSRTMSMHPKQNTSSEEAQ